MTGAVEYRCGSALRRAKAATHGLNGIDYLEVDPNTDINVPMTMRVVFLSDAGLTALTDNNFRITGGARYRNPAVATAAQTAAGSNVVLVTMHPRQLTDYSTYTLHLAEVGKDVPPVGFDPQLASVPFSFKVDCPAPFDCAPEIPAPAPPPTSEPELDYTARDWATLRRLMLDRLTTLLDGFADDTPVDNLVTHVEAMAYVADHLSYKLDAVATERSLSTARSRISLARHARLLDYPVHEGVNARCFVQFVYEDKPNTTLPAGTPLLPRLGNQPRTIDPDDFARLPGEHPVVFETMHELTLRNANNAIDFHTWSEAECVLPQGATSASLVVTTGQNVVLEPGDFLLLADTGGPDEVPDRRRRHVVRLNSVRSTPDLVEVVDVLDVGWDAADALPFDLLISAPNQSGGSATRAQAHGNIALADHGMTVPPRGANPEQVKLPQLDPPAAPETRPWRPGLEPHQVVRANSLDLSSDKRSAARTVLTDNDAATALPVLAIKDTFSTWKCRRDLLSSKPFDRHVVVETEHGSEVRLRFGDNVMALAPAPLSTLIVTGRFGAPLDGNIGSDALWHVVTKVTGIAEVNNPLPAVGGVPPLTPTVVRIEAPQAFRTQQRAVTEADWAEVAERHPDVSKAVARIRWTGSWRTAFVYVDRVGGRPVEEDKPFYAALTAYLEGFRLAGVDLALRGPVGVPLDIAFNVCVLPGHLRAEVLGGVLDRLTAGMSRTGQRGFFHPDSFTFGTPLYLSALIAAVMQVPGVASVEPVRFQRWGRIAVDELAHGVVHAGEIEVLRLDNDPNYPENGKLDIQLRGGA